MTTSQAGTPRTSRVEIFFAIMGLVVLGVSILSWATGDSDEGSLLVAGALALLCAADLVRRRTGRYLMAGAAMVLMIWFFLQR